MIERDGMAAWEIESRSWGGLIQPLSSHAKRILCRDAIGLCLESLRSPLEEALDTRTAHLAQRALDRLRNRADDSPPGEPDAEFQDCLRALRECDCSPAVASLVTALTECAGAMTAGLDASDVLDIMSVCHDAVLQAVGVDRTLAQVITAQRRLIDAAALV
jgi:hypothetical protein